jgi:hypothetical protein
LVIVCRSVPELYETLRAHFRGEQSIEVVLDRRGQTPDRRQRRKRHTLPEVGDRRTRGRRSWRAHDDELLLRGWTIIPLGRREATRRPSES